MTPASIAQCFVLAVAADCGIRLWLLRRQSIAVRTHRNRVPYLFRDWITLNDQQRSADYTMARVRQSRWSTLAEAAIKLSLTVGGGIAAAEALWRKFDLPEPWRGLAVIGSVFLLLQIVALPFALVRIFKVEARFGFNRVSPGGFALDWLKSVTLSVILGLPVALAALLLMQRAGAWWWLWAWSAWLVWTTGMAWATPRYIAPLFNRFTPLDDGEIKNRVESLLRRSGFSAAGGVFVMDGSRRSAHSNAYFTGIGRTKRIVFIDTLLQRINAEEIEAVMAHELGHYCLGHVTQRLVSGALLALLGFALLAWASQQSVIYRAFGIGTASAECALLLFAIASPVALNFARPLISWFFRRQETAADDFAVKHTDPKLLAAALIKLFRDNAATLNPDPLHAAYFDSHPPALARIERLQMSSMQRTEAFSNPS